MPRRNHPKHIRRGTKKSTIYYQFEDFSSLGVKEDQNWAKRCQYTEEKGVYNKE